jgi:hypothetical protein
MTPSFRGLSRSWESMFQGMIGFPAVVLGEVVPVRAGGLKATDGEDGAEVDFGVEGVLRGGGVSLGGDSESWTWLGEVLLTDLVPLVAGDRVSFSDFMVGSDESWSWPL